MRRMFVLVAVAMFGIAAFASEAADLKPTSLSNKSVPKKTANAPALDSGTSSRSVELPVRRVVLYKNGVGYFEHAGKVRGSQDLHVRFTTAQLNDVLKSLTVVDNSGGQVTGVRYNSIAPISERLNNLSVRLGENTTRWDFLRSLRGARVEVRSGGSSAVGRLLSVEQTAKTDPRTGAQTQVTQVAVMTDGGELRNFDINELTGVRFLEPELTREVGRYLSMVASSRAKDVRQMTISTSGTGERNISVSYVSEVPVWKSNYRIVLPSNPGEKALLQGWAIVDNTVGEDWNDVQLSLVAGAPQSFIQQISQPYYVRRPTVDLPKTALLTPQTHEGTMFNDNLQMMANIGTPPPPPPTAEFRNGAPASVAPGRGGGISGGVYKQGGGAYVGGTVLDPSGAAIGNANISLRNEQTGESFNAHTDANGNYSVAAPQGSYTIEVNSPGFRNYVSRNNYLNLGANRADATLSIGSASQAVEVNSSAISADSEEATIEAAEGTEIGDLFEYNLKQRITVQQNQSALVPIVNSRIDAEKVTVWNPDRTTALRALWITNSSGLTLDGGSFNIVDADAFAGEGLLQEVKPGEKRIISYAADPAVRVVETEDSGDRPYTHLKFDRGTMILTRELRSISNYAVRNSDTQVRQVVIEHPVRAGWKFVNGTKPDESSASHHRFRLAVEGGKTNELKIEEFHPEEARIALTNLTPDYMEIYFKGRTLSPAIADALAKISAKKRDISDVERQLQQAREEVDRINRDQNRVRENMKSLKGSSEEKALLQRYVSQLNQQEDRLAQLSKTVGDLDKERLQRMSELYAMVSNMSFDEAI